MFLQLSLDQWTIYHTLTRASIIDLTNYMSKRQLKHHQKKSGNKTSKKNIKKNDDQIDILDLNGFKQQKHSYLKSQQDHLFEDTSQINLMAINKKKQMPLKKEEPQIQNLQDEWSSQRKINQEAKEVEVVVTNKEIDQNIKKQLKDEIHVQQIKQTQRVQYEQQKKIQQNIKEEDKSTHNQLERQQIDFNVQQQNQLQLQEKQVEVKTSSKSIRIILGAFIFFILVIIITLLVIALVYNWFQKQTVIQEPSRFLVNNINRFKKNTCSKYDYVVTSKTQNQTGQINYQNIFCVEDVQKDVITFTACFLKQLEQNQTNYCEHIIFASSGGEIQDPQQQNSTVIGSDQSGSNYTLEDEYMKNVSIVHPIIKFGLYLNGSIAWIQFPEELYQDTLHFIKSFIEIYSPLVDKSLYVQSNQTQQRRRLQAQMNSTNGTQNLKQNLYSTNTTQEGNLVLQNQKYAVTADERQNSQQTAVVNSVYNGDQLQQASAASTADFYSQKLEQDDSHQTINFDISIQTEQTLNSIWIYTNVTTKDNVDQLKTLTQGNITYNLTLQQFQEYIKGDFNNSNQTQGNLTSRLLLNADGSLTLINICDKKFKIVDTKPIGVKIQYFAYSYINFKLTQDPQNPYKKTPLFTLDCGTQLNVGPFSQKDSILYFQKQLPPLTLKYTLQQIQGVINLLKNDFIGEVTSVLKNLLNGKIDQIFGPKIFQLNNLISNVLVMLNQQLANINPLQSINQVLNKALQIKSQIETQGQNLLNPKGLILQTIKSQLNQYGDQFYSEAISKFNQVQHQFQDYKSLISEAISNTTKNYNLDANFYKSMMAELIPADMLDQFNKQMQKALPIIQLIKSVSQGNVDYQSILKQNYDNHLKNFLNYSNQMLEQFINNNQTNLTNFYQKIIENRKNQVIQEYLNQVNTFEVLRNKINAKFNDSLINLGTNLQFTSFDWVNYYEDMYAKLVTNANNVAGNVGDCCDWHSGNFFHHGYCAAYNPVQYSLKNEPTMIAALKTGLEAGLNSAINSTNSFLSKVISIANENSDIPTKYNQLQMTYQTFIYGDISEFENNIQTRIDQTTSFRNQMCATPSQYIDQQINNLNELLSKVKQMHSYIDTTRSIFIQLNQTFILDVYNKLFQISTFPTTILDYYNRFEQLDNDTLNKIQEINAQINKFTIEEFLKSDQVQSIYVKLYDNFVQDIQSPCSQKNSFYQKIDAGKKQFFDKYTHLSYMRDTYYQDQINWGANAYALFPTTAYNTFKQLPLCQISKSLQNQLIEKIEPVLKEFKRLRQIKSDFQNVWSEKQQQIANIVVQAKKQLDIFYTLKTSDSYKKLTNSMLQFTNQTVQVFKTSIQSMSKIRQYSSEALLINVANKQKIRQIIQIFNKTEFTLYYSDVFPQIKQSVSIALSIIDKLSFDVIQFVVTGNQIYKLSIQQFNSFENGIKQFRDNCTQLLNEFINLPVNFDSTTLNVLTEKIKEIPDAAVSIIFPYYQNLTSLQKLLQFTNISKKQILQKYNLNVQRLTNFTNFIENLKFQMKTQLSTIINQTISKLSVLDISDVLAIYDIGKQLVSDFNEFKNIFSDQIAKFSNFKDLINQDFSQFFEIGHLILKIRNDIIQAYKSKTNLMLQRLNNKLQTIGPHFIKQFKNSSVYSELNALNQTLTISFKVIQEVTNKTIDQINQIVNSLGTQFAQKLKILTEIKKKISNIEDSVSGKLTQISSAFKNIEKGVFNIKNLIFTILSDDLQKTIIGNIQIITQNIDKIVQIDLANLTQLAQATFPDSISFLLEPLNLMISKYEDIVMIRQPLQQKLNQTIINIRNFLQTEIFAKFSNLRQAQLFIKSKIDQISPQGSLELYNRTFANKSVPILEIFIPIPVIIGVFYVTINLNYTLGVKMVIGLIQYRSIQANFTFSAGLVIQASFSYGILYIIEVGVFVRGEIVRGELKPRILLENIIPIQLVNSLVGVKDIVQKNEFNAYVQLFVGLYAFQLEYGFFIRFFTIQIIWVRIKFCIHVFFFRFCVNFRIPVGFIFLPKTWQFPGVIPGIGKEWQVLQLKMFTFKY